MLKPFADCIAEFAGSRFDRSNPESLAELDYSVELEIKNKAAARFWKENKLTGSPEPIVPSVESRHYRANSKRKCVIDSGRFRMKHPGGAKADISLLEPELHTKIYTFLYAFFSKKINAYAAAFLNYCIVKSAYGKAALILNCRAANGEVVRTFKHLSEQLNKELPEIVSLWMYLDETNSNYYLESKRPEHGLGIKKFFGPDTLSVYPKEGLRLLYTPTAFSQINESMIPTFVKTADELLRPEGRLLDLYCGYGLLGLSLADRVDSLIGMEIDGPSVDSAAAGARYLFPKKNIRFIRQEIGSSVIRKALPPPVKNEFVVLDPPRSGTANSVITELAKRTPRRVLHIFCGTDSIPSALAEWTHAGYKPEKIVPLDMFPGTAGMETFLLLTPAE